MHVRARSVRGVALLTFAIVAATHQSVVSQVCSVTELHKLVPQDVSPTSAFGTSVAISGDWAIAGAPRAISGFYSAGSAHFFRRNDGGTPGVFDDDTWLESARLVVEFPEPSQYFGLAVGISEDWAVVSAESDVDTGYREGTVYLYRRQDNTTPTDTTDDWWELHDKLTAFDGDYPDDFGVSLSLTDDWLAVGASGKRAASGSYGVGAAYVFRRKDGGTPGDTSDDRWVCDAKLTASDGRNMDRFGTSVSISYPWIVVGVPYDDVPSDSGSAYVFRRSAAPTPGLDLDEPWTEVPKLTIPEANRTSWFGTSVSVDGGIMVVGAPGSEVAEYRAGAAYVFELAHGGTPEDSLRSPWRLTGTLVAPGARAEDRFGMAVAVDGDWIVVGVPGDDDRGDRSGAAYVFGRNDRGSPGDPAGDSWKVIDKLTASTRGRDGRLAQSLAIDGETIAAGSNGAAYLLPFHTEEPYCGDACCNGNEDGMDCPRDCFGCGDHSCTGAENICSCPADCARTICGDGCLSGNEDCQSCPADCPELFSLDVPGLVGGYSCAWGPCRREQEFQFPVRFLSVDEAWLHVRGRNQSEACEPTDHRLHSLLDHVSLYDYVLAPSGELPFDADVPVAPTPNVYDGNGVIGLFLDTWSHCFDGGSIVTDATLWFSAVPSPPPGSLSDVAEFQCCYSGSSVVAEPPCRGFDHDADEDVDLADFMRFRMALEGP